MKFFVYIFLSVLLFASCADDPCLKGSGKTFVETRELPDSIITFQVTDNLDVDVYLSDRNYVEIEGGENVVPFIKTEMSDTTLVLENKNGCSFLRNFDHNLKIRLYLKSISKFMFDGSGVLNFMDTLKGNEMLVKSMRGSGTINLTVDVNRIRVSLEDGSVDVHIKGHSYFLNIYCTTTSSIDALDLKSIKCGITTESTGDCLITAEELIDAYIYSIGNIRYRGNPTIQLQKNTGSGQVIPY